MSKIIIAGSRSITNYTIIKNFIDECRKEIEITEIVSGQCPRGVDFLGERYAFEHNIPVKLFPAEWKIYGKVAGFKRNLTMARYADALIVIHNNSPGSLDMIKKAKAHNLKIFEKVVK